MSRYDFSEASDFLELEARITPEELHIEVVNAMRQLGDIETKRNKKVVTSVWDPLLTIADFLELITDKNPA